MTLDHGGPSVKRLAVMAYHSSPVHEPGAGDAGGMSVYVRELADALAERGVATDIFTRATSPREPVEQLGPGVRVVPVVAGPAAPVPKEHLPAFIEGFVDSVRAIAIVSRARYDVVHSHYWQSGLAGLALAEAWRAPLIHSHHTLGKVKNILLASGDSPEPANRLQGEERVIAGSAVLVASTDEECEHLACLYGAPHDRLKTIHPGVDHGAFTPGDAEAARARLGLMGKRVLLAVGRIQPLKGFDLALRALAELRTASRHDVVLVIVGGASGAGGSAELARLRALASDLGIEQHVRFEGPQPHRLLPVYYRAADAVVVCSHSESFGFAALEAHACARPVVATAVGGLAFIVEDGSSGFLLGTREPRLFAERLLAILEDDELRRRLGREGSRRAAAFSWAGASAQFLELYECLVSGEFVELCTC